MWNVIVGIFYMVGQISNLYFTCPGKWSNFEKIFDLKIVFQRWANPDGDQQWKAQPNVIV